MGTEDILQRWIEHFNNLLNTRVEERNEEREEELEPEMERNQGEDQFLPTLEETKTVLRTLKNFKAGGIKSVYINTKFWHETLDGAV